MKCMSHKNVILNFSQVFKTVVKSSAGSINNANSNEIEDDTVKVPFLHLSLFLQKTMCENT